MVCEEVFEDPRPFADVLMKIPSPMICQPSVRDPRGRSLRPVMPETNVLTIQMSTLLAYLDDNTGRDDPSDPPSHKAPAPADKTVIGKMPIEERIRLFQSRGLFLLLLSHKLTCDLR